MNTLQKKVKGFEESPRTLLPSKVLLTAKTAGREAQQEEKAGNSQVHGTYSPLLPRPPLLWEDAPAFPALGFPQQNATWYQAASDASPVQNRDAKNTKVKISLKKGIGCYLLPSKRWFPLLTLSLLATMLGITGMVPFAKADEVPERPNPRPDDEVTGHSQTLDVEARTRSHSTDSQAPHTSEAADASQVRSDSENFQDVVAASEATPHWTIYRLAKPNGLQGEQEEKSPSPSVESSIPNRSSAAANVEAHQKTTDISPAADVPAGAIAPTDTQSLKTPPNQGNSSFPLSTPHFPLPIFPVGNKGQKTQKQESHSPILNLPISPTRTVSQNNSPALPLTPSESKAEPLSPGTVRILTPQTGLTASRSTNLVVQYNANTQIQVSVNQKPLDPSTSTQQQRDEAQNIITQVWYNIPLKEGENTLSVQAGDGTPLSIQLTVKEIANRKIEITPSGNPSLPADGRSVLTLQGRITDENGQAIAEDVLVTLTASAGKFVGADADNDRPGFQVVARAGQFTTELQSGLEAQKVRIRAAVEPNVEVRSLEGRSAGSQPSNLPTFQPSNSQASTPIEAYTQVEFVTNLRPSLVSGVVNFRIGTAGTNFWGSRRDFLNPDKIGDGTEVNLEGAVFGTGRIGEWLFTGAYNSARPLNQTCDGTTRLFRGPQFCEQQYPVYGDSSTVNYLTPSTDSVYLRFERTSRVPGAEPDYGMWGDYNTQEFARSSQLFSATTRQLHGFKGNYNFGNLQLSALYSRDVEGFQRDTIQPNGTSGYYFLSRRLLVAGSENVFLETEQIDRPGTVISRKPLGRGSDYEIDYDRGTLLFRRPILATEFDPFGTTTGTISEGSPLLVRRIVVTYQYESEGGDDTSIYAGRVQYNLSQAFKAESWLGATYLREDQGIRDFELYGADFLVSLGQNGQLIGEYAHSFYDSPLLGGVEGSAYRLEASARIIPGLSGRAFYRSVEENFNNEATTSYTPGQTRYGAELASQIGPTTSIQVGYDHEVNFGISPLVRTDLFDLYNPGVQAPPGSRVDNSLTTIRAGVQQQIGAATLGIDYVNRSRDDRISDTFTGDASQLVSRLAIPLTQSLAFRAQNELNLSESDPLYPNRTTFGLDWAAYPGVTVRLAHQFFDGGLVGSNSITSLDTILEHKLGENTSLTGRYSVISGFNAVTGQGAVGLNHRWVVTPGLRINLGYEHTFSNISTATAAGVRFAQPYSVGQTAAALGLFGGDVFSVGVEYTDSPDFKASARIEHRTGSGNNNTVLSAAAAGKITPALTILGRFEQANFANQLIEGLGNSATFRLGLAYRDPASDRWNALMRYEYRLNPSTIPDTLLISSGTGSEEHVLALEAIYAPSWRWEFYGKGAFRRSTTYSANNFINSSNVYLSQLRTSYRLGYRMDLAVEGRWIGQSSPNYNEFGVAVETGYYLTPDLRVAVGYSFGSVDDRDFTGYRSQGGPYLNLTFKVNELFGGFGRQRVVPRQQQESQVKPVAGQRQPTEPGRVNPASEK